MNSSLINGKLRLDFTQAETDEIKVLLNTVAPPPPPVVVNPPPPPSTTEKVFSWEQIGEGAIRGSWTNFAHHYVLRIRIKD